MKNYQTQDTLIMALDKEEQIKELFWSTLETAKENRLEFLLKACDGDNELYEEVISLLASYEEADSFLEKPVANFAAKLVKEEKESLASTSKETFLEQLSGRVLDSKYLIEKQLGQGGMGAVYQAVHLGTKRPVALKVIAPQFMTHSEFVERFKREAEAAGRLSHHNVVNVTDFGIASFGSAKVAYLVMEYLKGLTLGDLIKKKGKLPVSFTIDILQQVCSAIEEAHNQSIIHRDLKPDNIWLEPTGRGTYHVKVLDFGLAKLHSNPLSASNNNLSIPSSLSNVESKPISLSIDYTKKIPVNIPTQAFDEKETKILGMGETAGNIDPRSVPEWMTRVGMVLGTPLYMSPEQCHGKHLDARSDIYSLGIIAYQMLCGETPFTGDMYQLIQKHSEMPPIPLQKKLRDIPKPIADVVMTALAKNPTDRFPSAKAFSTALEANLEGEVPLIHQSFGIYWKNFTEVIRISIPINFIFVVLTSLISTVLQYVNFDMPFANSLQLVWWLLPMLIIFLVGDISAGAFSLAIKDLQQTAKISSKTVVSTVGKKLHLLLANNLHSYLLSVLQIWKFIFPTFKTYVQYSFTSPITMLEEIKGDKILERSKTLITKFYSLAFSLKLRTLLIRVIAFTLFLSTFMLNTSWFNGVEMDFLSRLVTTFATVLMLPGLFLMVASPLTDMAMAMLYFKAREANGESVFQSNLNEELSIVERIKFSAKRKIFLAASLVISILFSSFSYILIIPPFGKHVHTPRPNIEKVADSENAWIDYNRAIQDVIDFPVAVAKPTDKSVKEIIGNLTIQNMKDPGYANLEDAAFGKKDFNEKQLAYLDSHQGAIKYLLSAAKKPKAQFSSELPSINSPTPNLLELRALAHIAAAEVRRLQQKGKVAEAVELALANYKMAIDIGSDTTGTLIALLISIVCRGIAAKSLLTLIYSNTTDAKMDTEIARQITYLDSRIPNAYQALATELRGSQISLEDLLLNADEHTIDNALGKNMEIEKIFIKTFPGLRTRVYNNYAKVSEKYLDTIKPSLETWDFQSKLYQQSFNDLVSVPYSIDGFIAYYLFSMGLPSGLATMKSLYTCSSISQSVAIFASASAYKKLHGEFPTTLELAISEVNLPMPIDLTTKKTVGYRLENNMPIAWFAGVDGQDDGGIFAYKFADYFTAVSGKDLVFYYNTFPFESGQ